MSECEHSQPGDEDAIKEKLTHIGHTFVVLSGKGGVGKSTVAVNLALSLSALGFRTGVLDTDIHGPSVPKLIGLSGERLQVRGEEILPFTAFNDIKVVSMGLLIDGNDSAVIWRGPMKSNIIRQFFGNVAWGDLDYLIVDSPPGTGDEPLSVGQLLSPDKSSAIIVTTPQQVATIDVEKSITFCRQLSLPISGIIENMSGFVCPHCGQEVDIFSTGGGSRLAQRFDIPFIGAIPLDPDVVKSGDAEMPYVKQYAGSKTAGRFAAVVQQLVLMHPVDKEQVPTNGGHRECTGCGASIPDNGSGASVEVGPATRFAVPTNDKKLCGHFGHCEAFALFDVDSDGKLSEGTYVVPPPHEPGLLPPWIAQQGVNCVIAGGMGARAQQLFADQGVRVITGAQGEDPREVVENYLKGTLTTGSNTCDH